MIKKRNHNKTRRIWINAFGPIPYDENGVSYEIHHINGDFTDDRLENLQCLSKKAHRDLHNAQGDYSEMGAHFTSDYQRNVANGQVIKGTHPFQNKEMHTKRVTMQKQTRRHSNYIRASCVVCHHETSVACLTKHLRKHL